MFTTGVDGDRRDPTSQPFPSEKPHGDSPCHCDRARAHHPPHRSQRSRGRRRCDDPPERRRRRARPPTRPPLGPNVRLGHAEDYLRMASDRPPAAAAALALDAYLVTVIDHGMNASTFAARVVASTASDTVSAVVAGIGALKGKLHGGAPGPVLDMLDAIRGPDRARAWLEGSLARGERIMGMGH